MRRLLAIIFIFHSSHVLSFVPKITNKCRTNEKHLYAVEEQLGESPPTLERPCFYKPVAEGNCGWKERIHIRDLKVGQQLSGYVVEDYLDGKTCPKLYFECGIGRTTGDGQWRIVNGMLRLARGKASVTKKRAARLRKKKQVDLYVSRIQIGCGRLEVVQEIEDVERYQTSTPKVPISSLKVGQEVKGKVTKLVDYGAFVDVGANRQGLLHIQKVADLLGKYVDKEKGLIMAGLERGAMVKLSVESNSKRRLSLDFTPDVKAEAEKDREKKLAKQANSQPREEKTSSMTTMSTDELRAWEAYGSETQASVESDKHNDDDEKDEDDDDDDEYYDDDDEYDEDKDIEDSLGLGFY